MFGLFAGIKDAIIGFAVWLWTLVAVFGIGAVFAVAMGFVHRFFGTLVAGVAGGVVMIGLYYSGMAGFVTDYTKQQEIERLARINDELARAKRAAEEIAKFEQEQAADLIASVQEREKKLAAALTTLDDECGLSEKELDSIKELQR